jgi:catechol 2,3-dioxygenase-like lactoylglutathione lyase family enzyme
MLKKLHHVAYRCKDAAETVDFYTNVLGLKFSHAIAQDRVPSTQAWNPHLHVFFEMEDKSSIAFFELPDLPPMQPDPNTPNWVQHLALEVKDMDTMQEGVRRLRDRGVAVIGPIDHHFCQSVYFFDPSGHRLEMTVRTETNGDQERFATQARVTLADWQARKAEAAHR